jgi:hypothetical protein
MLYSCLALSCVTNGRTSHVLQNWGLHPVTPELQRCGQQVLKAQRWVLSEELWPLSLVTSRQAGCILSDEHLARLQERILPSYGREHHRGCDTASHRQQALGDLRDHPRYEDWCPVSAPISAPTRCSACRACAPCMGAERGLAELGSRYMLSMDRPGSE